MQGVNLIINVLRVATFSFGIGLSVYISLLILRVHAKHLTESEQGLLKGLGIITLANAVLAAVLVYFRIKLEMGLSIFGAVDNTIALASNLFVAYAVISAGERVRKLTRR